MAKEKRKSFAGFLRNPQLFDRRTRSKNRASKNLGIIEIDLSKHDKMYRDAKLELLDSYYENRQFEHLQPWDKSVEPDNYVEVRKRKPRIQYPFAKVLCKRIIAMAMGGHRWPAFNITENPDDQEFFRTVAKVTNLKSEILEPMRRLVGGGSVFTRFHITDGVLSLEHYLAKYCWPTFTAAGELESIIVKHVYVDMMDKDVHGDFAMKWFKMELTQFEEIMYDNPPYDPEAEEEPEFVEVDRVEHDMGFVQGVWWRTSKKKGSPDGDSVICDLTDFIDEMCYSLSQTSHSIGYNQEPILAINGLDEEEIATIIRSVSRSLSLGREGKASFLESNLSGVEKAGEFRDKIKLHIGEIAQVVFNDPDKMAANAQSGEAMKQLHAPMIELVEELRGVLEPALKELIIKMGLAIVKANVDGIDIPIEMPDGYVPTLMDLEIKWRPIFQQTIDDLAKKVSAASAAVMGRGISEETFTRFIAEDFGVTDVEEERKLIDARPPPNPFGGF